MALKGFGRDPGAGKRSRQFQQALNKLFFGSIFEVASNGGISIAADAITDAMLRNSAAVSVIGRAANSAGNPADIAAGANDRLLTRVSDALAFTQLTVGMFPDDVVTYAKLQNVSATDRLLGRDTAGAGNIEELTVGGGIEFTGTGIQTSAFTGDVTKSAGGTALTVANNAVTYAKIQDVSAASRVLGRGSAAGAGDQQELTVGNGIEISATALQGVNATAVAKGVVNQGAAVADATGAGDVVAQFNALLASLRTAGVLAT